jgi:hypothetical protein
LFVIFHGQIGILPMQKDLLKIELLFVQEKLRFLAKTRDLKSYGLGIFFYAANQGVYVLFILFWNCVHFYLLKI